MAQTAKTHTDNKRRREAKHFVNQLLDRLLAGELDAPAAASQANAVAATGGHGHPRGQFYNTLLTKHNSL